MKKQISILLIIILVLGIFISCDEANINSQTVLDRDREAALTGFGTLIVVYLIEASFRVDDTNMPGLTGTYSGDADGTFSFVFTNFSFDTEDEESSMFDDSLLLNGTHSRSISGTTATENLDMTLKISDGGETQHYTVKITMAFDTTDEDADDFPFTYFEVNGKTYTSTELENLFDFEE